MTPEMIVQAVEDMGHSERMVVMVAYGRRSLTEPDVADALATLAQGDWYARYLALGACYGSRNDALAVRALHDPSHSIRSLAINVAPLICTPEVLLAALDTLPPDSITALFHQLRRRQMVGVIDAFLARANTLPDAQWCRWIVFGSARYIDRERFETHADRKGWRTLAHYHPDLVLDWLTERASAATRPDEAFTTQLNQLLTPLLTLRGKRVIALVTTHTAALRLNTLDFAPLIRRYPEEMAWIVFVAPLHVAPSFRDVADRLSLEMVIALYQRNSAMFGNEYQPITWLDSLTPTDRAAFWAACQSAIVTQYARAQRRGSSVAMMARAIEWWPAIDRAREARRLLSATGLSEKERLALAIYLPFDEVLPILETLLHDPDVAIRVSALSVLIKAGRFAPTRLGAILELLQERRTERDPVRDVIYRNLYALPPGRWRTEYLPALAALVRHGLNDYGLSSTTHQSMMRLLMRLAAFHPQWSAEQIATVIRERGFVAPTSAPSLPATARTAVFVALRPIWEQWDEQGEAAKTSDVLVYLAQCGHPLTEMLDWVAQRAVRWGDMRMVDLVAQHDYPRLAEIIPGVVKEKLDAIESALVAGYLLRHEKASYIDALEALATRQGQHSFTPHSTAFIGFTERQQARIGDIVAATIDTPKSMSTTNIQAVRALAFLPALSLERFTQLSVDEHPVIHTAAIFALGHVDTDESLPLLVAALDDSRARIAVLGLRRFLRRMSTADALALVISIPRTRVTVTKEIIRLLSELQGDAAFAALIALGKTDLHRDVRAAWLRLLWEHNDRSEIWPLLESAIQDTDTVLVGAAMPTNTVVIPVLRDGRRDAAMRDHIYRVLALAVQHPDSAISLAACMICQRYAVADEHAIVVPHLHALLRTAGMTDSHFTDATYLARAVYLLSTPRDAPALATIVRTRLNDRRFVSTLVEQLKTYASSTQRYTQLRPLMNAVLEVLESDPLCVGLQLVLLFAYLPPPSLTTKLIALSEGDLLHADAVTQAIAAFTSYVGQHDRDALNVLLDTLATSSAPHLRRLAVAVVHALGQRYHWAPLYRDWMLRLRADPAPLVASAAQFLYVPEITAPDA